MLSVLLQVLQFGISEIVPLEQLAAKLHSIYTLDPNAEVNIQHLGADAIDADTATIDKVNAWRLANGFPALGSTPLPAISAAAAAGTQTAAGPQLVASAPTAVADEPAPAAAAVEDVPPAAADLGDVGVTGDHGELGANKPPPAAA